MRSAHSFILAVLLVTRTAALPVLAQDLSDRADNVKGRDTPQQLVATYESARARKDWRTCFSCFDRRWQAEYVMGVFFGVGMIHDEELAAIVKKRLRIEFTDPGNMEIPDLRLDDDVPNEILLYEAVQKRVDDLPGFIDEFCRWADAKGQTPLFNGFHEVGQIQIHGDRAVGTYLPPPSHKSAEPKVDEPADQGEPRNRVKRLPLDFCRVGGKWYFTIPDPPPLHSKEERARKLKSNIQMLWITLGICGDSSTSVVVEKERDGKLVPETIEISGSELRLGMNSGRHGSGFYQVGPRSFYAGLTDAQAMRLIDYLASEGFLKQAREPDRQKIPYSRPEWRNWTRLQVSVSQDTLLLHEDLGWGPAMRKRLEGLRRVLEGDAAKAMDEILSRLPDER